VKGKQITKSRKAKFRSGLERKISQSLKLRKCEFEYETEKILYTVPEVVRSYTPDFIITTKSGKKIYVEGKGIWDAEDRRKHWLIRDQRPDLDIRFVFTNSKSKISKRSRCTYGDICRGGGRGEYKGITWKFAEKRVPQEWIDE